MTTRDPEKLKAARERRNAKRRKGVGRGNHGNHRRGPTHYRWNNGVAVSSHGYLKVAVGVGHPLADPNGYAYVHDLVMTVSLGRMLQSDEIVHHLNEVKTDNRIQNLQLLTRTEHGVHHASTRERNELGQWGGRTHAAGGRLLDGRTWDQFPEPAREGASASR